MVCAKIEKPARIAGGFVLVEVSWLMGAWRACRSAPLGVGDFRTLLACREMLNRRCFTSEGRAVTYDVPELAKLLGVAEKRARASVRRLETAGLIQWSESAIGFPELVDRDLKQIHDTIGRGEGAVAIPRRMLRLLVGGARPAMIATAMGMLLRCLSRRKGGFDGWGRVKASWIASAFAVDQRRVKQARKDLVTLGWIEHEPDRQRAMNRWGRAYRINLAWDRVDVGGPSLPPLPLAERPEIATPSVDQDPLPERVENQEPASGGPAGVEVSGQEPQTPTPVPAPRLDDVRPEDLRDVGRTLQLHGQAIARKLADPSEAGRLRFVALAEHARVVGTVNPGGLFARLVRRGLWHFATLDDEDTARRKLREHLHGRPFPVVRSSAASLMMLGLSEDARLVREVRTAMIRAGIFRDPWPAFQARNPGWNRGRWDAAMGELGLN
jgi:hypothetical protein